MKLDNDQTPWIRHGMSRGEDMAKKTAPVKTHKEPQIERLLDQNEIVSALGISLSTLKDLRRKGLPFVRLGRLVKYRATEVNNWLRERQISAS